MAAIFNCCLSEGNLLIGKRPFQDRAMSEKICPFQGTSLTSSEDPLTLLQLIIKGLTASKMNAFHYLALQFEALIILLQETHYTNAKKLVLPDYQLAWSSLSRKLGLAHNFPGKKQILDFYSSWWCYANNQIYCLDQWSSKWSIEIFKGSKRG